MRFFQTLFAAAAFVAAAVAVKPEIHDFPAKIVPGKTYEITYSPADDTPTTFVLRKGDNLNLEKVTVLTTSATKGKFSWTVSKDLPNRDDYALEIIQGADTNNNYIGPIALSGSTASDLPSSSSAAPSTTAASSGKPTGSTTASASVSTTAGSNSTVTSATLSRTTSAPTGTTTTGSNGPPQSTGAASNLGSPLALVLGGFAAMVYFN
jgi:hypothetical protein